MSGKDAGEGLDRRTFLKASALAGGGLALGIPLSGCGGAGTGGNGDDLAPDAWLLITPDNRVIFQLDKAEMGQGVITGLPTLLGEELDLNPAEIHVHLASVDPQFRDPMQVTGGSTSMARRWEPVRKSGAAAREMLRKAAAEKWSVAMDEIMVRDGRIDHASTGRSASYGDLARAASRQSVPRNPPLKEPATYRWIGHSVPRTDRVIKSTGTAIFGLDVGMGEHAIPDMATAVVLRCPRFGATLASFDGSAARALPGVSDVFAISSGVAVVASGYWSARQAAKEVTTTWSDGPLAGLDSAQIEATQRQALAEHSGRRVRNDGDVERAAASAARVIESEYLTPYLAHATMEPMNCTAWAREAACDIWAPTQAPDMLQAAVARLTGLTRSRVNVHCTLLGGGFGRRAMPDFALEAVEISRRAGRPVKVVWSREDDMRHDYYRPATCNRLRASIAPDGTLSAWEHRLVGPSILSPLLGDFLGALLPGWVPGSLTGALGHAGGSLIRSRDPTLTEGADDLPYAIDNIRVESQVQDPGVPIGFWRSVGHSQNAFVVESFVDEVAHALDEDPLMFRLTRLADHPRHLAVLHLAAEQADWGKPPPGRFQGVAVHESFDSLVAEIAEVSVTDGDIRVHRVVCAVDCGLAVNPDIVRAQMQGGIIFGLTAALKSRVTLKDGGIAESNFHDYPLLRIEETPQIDVHIVPRDTPPTGVGEPGTPPIAPAVANAVFAATGVRLRRMPLTLTF
ncbi:MAG: molybdopterin cofactor-binding domain-containing protein [Chromatocurvus sp.]